MSLTDRIAAARDRAADQAGDIRIKEFLRAMTIWPDVRSAGDPDSVSIMCHSKSWHRYFMPKDLAELRVLSDDALASRIGYWLQSAFEKNMLSLSNPPTGKALDTAELAVLLSSVGAIG